MASCVSVDLDGVFEIIDYRCFMVPELNSFKVKLSFGQKTKNQKWENYVDKYNMKTGRKNAAIAIYSPIYINYIEAVSC